MTFENFFPGLTNYLPFCISLYFDAAVTLPPQLLLSRLLIYMSNAKIASSIVASAKFTYSLCNNDRATVYKMYVGTQSCMR